ncbi:alcohol dehydrogenase catalytic domain-containing protein [Agrococcus sp. KRD186]|uniref:alcohol dehydrogenase catalytic domain-containing protein n=1 Tax=Agrococcus sp. KRD186 TaxID=2729730 RepID=UPI0019D2FD2F
MIEGTVLVRVKAAGLNPIDNAITAGLVAQMGVPHEYPLVLGRDAAGIVEAVGADVDNIAVGDEVIGHVLLAPPVSAGTLAEYVLLPLAAVTHKPAELDFAAAAALPLAGGAAVACVEAIDPRPGQTVLVNGASGGVGSFAVQLLAARGARVVATGAPTDVDRLTALGAALVVDFTAGRVAEQVLAAHPDGVDALVNLAGFAPDAVPAAAVRAGGIIASTTVLPDQADLDAASLTGVSVMAAPTRGVIAPLAEQAAAGDLEIAVASVLPLERAIDGLAGLAAGSATGKVVVTLDD